MIGVSFCFMVGGWCVVIGVWCGLCCDVLLVQLCWCCCGLLMLAVVVVCCVWSECACALR